MTRKKVSQYNRGELSQYELFDDCTVRHTLKFKNQANEDCYFSYKVPLSDVRKAIQFELIDRIPDPEE